VIDITTEKVRNLHRIRRYVTKVRGGKPIHPATLYRWANDGCAGVKLETIKVGGTTCTSIEALQRFFAATTRARHAARRGHRGTDRPEQPAPHQQDERAIVAELERLGL
jgi:hypothetical protein